MTTYSVCSAVIFYNVASVVVFLLHRKAKYLEQYTVSSLMFLMTLAVIRLVAPVDIRFAYVIESHVIFPAIENVLTAEPVGYGLSPIHVLCAVWIIGIIVYICKDIATHIRDYRRRMVFLDEGSEYAQSIASEFCPYPVLVTSDVPSPCGGGLLHPIIYLPKLAVSDEMLKLTIRHEMLHIRYGDAYIKLLFNFIRDIFWWNPVSHLLVKELDRLLELRVDQKIMSKLDKPGMEDYKYLLMTVAVQTHESKYAALANLAGGSDSEIVERIRLIDEEMVQRKKKNYFLCAVFFLLFLASYVVILQPYRNPPQEEIIGTVNTLPEDMYIKYEDGKYYLCSEGNVINEISEELLDTSGFNRLEIIGD